MTRPGTAAERDALNRRYQELENQLPAAFPAQRDGIIQEMEDIERRLRELSVPNARRGRSEARTVDTRDRRQL